MLEPRELDQKELADQEEWLREIRQEIKGGGLSKEERRGLPFAITVLIFVIVAVATFGWAVVEAILRIWR